MNILSRLFHGHSHKNDLERHDQIVQQMVMMTVKIKSGDPISRMVRGEWTSEDGHDVLTLETVSAVEDTDAIGD